MLILFFFFLILKKQHLKNTTFKVKKEELFLQN